jgi:LysR family nitrogen assimilation transcriptional regulator
MDITQIRHFVRVAETGSYIKAADLFNVGQSTLSRQVRALEVELRVNLFYRHGRGVLLTDAGKRFLEYARAMLHTVDAAMLSIRDSSAAYSGSIVIGMVPSVGRVCIPTLVSKLTELYPRASISVIEGLSGPLYEGVLLGQMDFALLYNPPASPNIKISPIITEPLYAIGAHPVGKDSTSVTLTELASVPLILPHGNHSVRVAVEAAAARKGLAVNIALQVDGNFSIMELASQGMGHSVFPRLVARAKRLPPLTWQKVVEPVLETTLCMALSTQQMSNPLIAESAEVVRTTLIEMLSEESLPSL